MAPTAASIVLLVSSLLVAVDGFACITSCTQPTLLAARRPHARACATDGSKEPSEDAAQRGQEYYQGMLNSPLDFRADEDLDNITPNMKLVMGASSFAILLTAIFILGNAPPPTSYT